MEHNDEITKILESANYCKKRNLLIFQMANAKNILMELAPQTNVDFLMNRYMKGHSFVLFHIFYWIVSIIAFCQFNKELMNTISQKLSNPVIQKYKMLPWFEAFRPEFQKLVLCFLPFVILYAAILIGRRMTIKKKCQTKAKEKLSAFQQVSQDIANMQHQINGLETEMSDPQCCIIPPTYWNVGEQIEKYVLNQRAHTLTAAINLYELERQFQMQRSPSTCCPRCGSAYIDTCTTTSTDNNNSSIVIGLLLFFFLPFIGWIVGLIILCTSSSSVRTVTVNTCKNCGLRY